MYGRAAIVLRDPPRRACRPGRRVQTSSGESSVFIVTGKRARRRRVELGVDGERWLEITAGLSVGENVVVAGADNVSDGAEVRPVAGIDPFSGERSKEGPAPSTP